MHEYVGSKVLATTTSWFYGKDGEKYNAVFGTLKGVHEAGKTLGFIPNRSHANWFIEIGDMTIMGCQVLYIIKCDAAHLDKVNDWYWKEDTKEVIQYQRPTAIYNADNNS